MDARGTPERVVGTHLRDQRPQLGINLGAALRDCETSSASSCETQRDATE